MAPPKPESLDIPLRYGGKSYVVRFSTRAMSRLKDHWGLHTDPPDAEKRRTGDAKLGDRLSLIEVEDIPVMLWACLRSNHPEITIEDVEEMVDQYGVGPLQPVLAQVLAAAMPPEEAGQKKSPTKKSR